MEAVKGARRYDASRRRRHAALTQQRVLEVAERLFVERGYAATTIADIAAEADVSVKSVYASLGDKRRLVRRLMDVRVAGDQAPVALSERGWHQRMLAEPDARQLLRLFAMTVREILDRVSPMIVVLRQAAAADPALADEYQRETRTKRYESQRAVGDELARRGALRRGLTAEAAADTVWTVASPESYEALVIERGWRSADFETWLGDALIALLLPPSRTTSR